MQSFPPVVALVLAACSACGPSNDPVDPDGRHRPTEDDRAAAEARVREIPLRDVVAAAAGVPLREAPIVLARWLSEAGPRAEALLARWPRKSDGALDLERPPVSATAVDADLALESKSRCGEVKVIFRGATPPALRLRLPIPSTARACREARREARLHDGEALSALGEAIKAASVPDLDPPPTAKAL